jgi:hypothetical protein
MADQENLAQAASQNGATDAPKQENISPEEATKLLMTGAALLQQQWLQASVNVAKTLSNGQPISPGGFEDLRRMREHFEELERANNAITRIAQAQKTAQEEAKKDNSSS